MEQVMEQVMVEVMVEPLHANARHTTKGKSMVDNIIKQGFEANIQLRDLTDYDR